MSRKLMMDEFIARSQAIHGEAYDYSNVVLTGVKTRVEIICWEHGPFLQTPEQHMLGAGCPVCAKEKRRQTMLDRYGVEYASQSADMQVKSRATRERKFGGMKPPGSGRKAMSTDEFIRRAREVHGDTYDYSQVNYVNNSTKVRIICPVHGAFEQTPAKHLLGQGCPNLECIQARRGKTEKSGVTCESKDMKPVDMLYDMLVNRFGTDDIIRDYSSDIYPWPCRFYIPSRELYIETGGIWSDADMDRQDMAASHGLNYIIFWDDELWDARVWFALDCPDGQDWKRAYSWLPDRDLTGTGIRDTGYNLIAKRYQFQVFYAREIALWNENNFYKNWPSIRMFIYANRLKYLGKVPGELSDLQIVNAFTISGVIKGYTVFDTAVMDEVVKKYNLKSIYDPCAGWGERMLYCFQHDIVYHGMDVNPALESGYENMIRDFGMTKQVFTTGDSSVDLPGCDPVDAVLTCPPYGPTEIYSPYGAENLSPDQFLDWWRRVVELLSQVNPKYFCFQVNRKYRDDMLDIVATSGFFPVEEIFCRRRSSHMTRSKNGVNHKTEQESMLVLQREI